MPHLPDHRNHDLALIAAHAAGDAAGAELDQARELVAACDECAALHHDLRAISAALPATAAPVRTRDFRLTPEQAASLRPAGWRRLLAPLAGPRFAFAAPLGGSLAALGIAGILVAGAASTPLANVQGEAGRQGAPAAAPADQRPTDTTSVELDGAAASAPADQPAYVAQPSQPAPQAGGANGYELPAASQLPGDTTVVAPAPNEWTGEIRSSSNGGAAEDPVAGDPADEGTVPSTATATDLLASPFATLAFVLLAAGLVLVGARWAARRAA